MRDHLSIDPAIQCSGYIRFPEYAKIAILDTGPGYVVLAIRVGSQPPEQHTLHVGDTVTLDASAIFETD